MRRTKTGDFCITVACQVGPGGGDAEGAGRMPSNAWMSEQRKLSADTYGGVKFGVVGKHKASMRTAPVGERVAGRNWR